MLARSSAARARLLALSGSRLGRLQGAAAPRFTPAGAGVAVCIALDVIILISNGQNLSE